LQFKTTIFYFNIFLNVKYTEFSALSLQSSQTYDTSEIVCFDLLTRLQDSRFAMFSYHYLS